MNSLFRRLCHGQDGQTLYLVAVMLAALLGAAALSIDIGFVLHATRELQASADAAATAGALDLSNNLSASTAQQTARCYSADKGYTCANGQTSGLNAYADLRGVTMSAGYPVVACLSQLTALGLACNNAASANAIAVQEQVDAPTFFAKLFGINSIKLKAQALAAMKGGTPAPANIEILVDTTPSMNYYDFGCTVPGISYPTQEDCAKYGVRTLLMNLAPCAAGLASCGTAGSDGNVTNAVNEVGLLTFPGLASSSDASKEYTNCQASTINGAAAYTTSTTTPPYYSVIPLSSNYRTSATSGLNGSSSNLVKAVDWKDGAGCTTSAYGLQVPQNLNTYYATVLTQAQAALSALQAPRASMQSAIIIISDGDATAQWSSNGPPPPSGTCNRSYQSCSDFTSSTPQTAAQYECHQAITAAQNAAATANSAGLKTWVYTIAYGASTSSYGSCSSDRNPPGSPAPASNPISACDTLRAMASDANKFYSDNTNGCQSAAHPSITSLSQIFQNISYDFLTTRLLPTTWYNNGTW
jgi:hypothetical protein